jgi:hypothetical protein
MVRLHSDAALCILALMALYPSVKHIHQRSWAQVCQVHLVGDAAEMWGDTAWEHTIRLLTGRTHQIRAQMAALQAPLLGDALYRTMLQAGAIVPISPHEDAASAAHGPCSQQDCASVQTQERSQSSAYWVARYRHNSQQDQPLGLQACSLSVSGDGLFGHAPFHVDAGDPWWRARVP